MEVKMRSDCMKKTKSFSMSKKSNQIKQQKNLGKYSHQMSDKRLTLLTYEESIHMKRLPGYILGK